MARGWFHVDAPGCHPGVTPLWVGMCRGYSVVMERHMEVGAAPWLPSCSAQLPPHGKTPGIKFPPTFFFGICRNLKTLPSHGSTEQPHTEHLPFPKTTSCPRAWHSPFSAPTRAPWLSPAPTWIPITLSDPGPQCWGHWPRVPPSSAPSHRAELFCLHTTLPPCLPPFPPFPLLAKHTGKGRDFNLLPGTN